MTRRSPGEGSLYRQRTHKKLWVASVEIKTFDGGRKQVRKYSTTKSGAAAKLRKLRVDVAQGNLPVTGRTTVAQWLELWLETAQKPRVRPATYRWYSETIRSHIIPQIGAQRLDRLTAQHVRQMVASIPSTRNRQRAHQTLRMALKAAVAEGMIPRNVAALVPRPGHLPKPRTALSADIAARLIQAALDMDRHEGAPQLATRWITGLLLGARRGELLGLEWDRVDLVAGTADLSWQLQQLGKVHGCDTLDASLDGIDSLTETSALSGRGLGFGKSRQDGNLGSASPLNSHQYPCGRTRPGYCPQARWDFQPDFEYRDCYKSLVWTRPKTKAGQRIVPLEWPLLPMLEAHYRGQKSPRGLVWHWPDGRPISPREDHDLWHALLEHAGLQSVPLHTLRHTAATLMQADHVPDDVRMQIMGQSSYAAQRGYVHMDQTQPRAAVRRLGERLMIEPKLD
jgi:integrase